MAKRHHHMMHKHASHHKGAHHLDPHHEGVGPEYYSGASARHAMEKKDEGMIYEDHRAVANLPQEVMIKPWPMSPGYLPEVLDDTISGVDSQMSYDNARKMGGYEPKKV